MEFPSFDLQGKKALVTGGNSGIGYHAALSLARTGCEVFITGRHRETLEKAADELKKLGCAGYYHAADLADTKDAIAMARRADEVLGGVDILVNNAGTTFVEPALAVTEEHWDNILAVNLKAPFFIAQQVAPGMIRRKYGKIIMVSSLGGLRGVADHAAYCSSKGGMTLLTKVLATEWAQYNINVNAVAPTVVLTPMGEKVWGAPEKRAAKIARIPQGRLGALADVSGAILFLASPASDFINGETIAVDGGSLAQ
ncbi:MAG: SDR family oxidoreductase [Deltaproteobacteria bacterium]|nr:SDR family oxidoreductase [Deltaproteobacteria bacterium]